MQGQIQDRRMPLKLLLPAGGHCLGNRQEQFQWQAPDYVSWQITRQTVICCLTGSDELVKKLPQFFVKKLNLFYVLIVRGGFQPGGSELP